jgi:hypothetical protein
MGPDRYRFATVSEEERLLRATDGLQISHGQGSRRSPGRYDRLTPKAYRARSGESG